MGRVKPPQKFFIEGDIVTRNGIYYNLLESPYAFTLDGIQFFFSSESHMEKFKDKYRYNRNVINASLSNRFKFDINVDKLADFILYRKVETRGFLVIDINKDYGERDVIQCEKDLIYDGGKMTPKN